MIDLTCRELVDFVGDYLAGDLPPDVRTAFDAHLAECPECLTYLRSYADTVRLARGAGTDPVPPALPTSLVRAILVARRRHS